MIYFLFAISTILNGFLVWYCYSLLKDRVALVEIFKEFSPLIKRYEEHLISLTKMEMYFGEPTIVALLDHTKELNKTLDDLVQSIEVEEDEDDEKE